MSKEVTELRCMKAKEEKKWWFKNKKDIERLECIIKNAECSNAKKHQEMEELLNAMKNNSKKLTDELESIPYVYVNGERCSFSQIIE